MTEQMMQEAAGKVIPAGYKQTEVGIIPEDWTVANLSAITEHSRPISYGIVQTGPLIVNGVPCIRVVDISDGKIKKDNLITTTKEISDSYRRTILKDGDLIIPLRGKVGEVGLVDGDLVGANLTRGVALIAPQKDYASEFIKQYLSNRSSADRLLSSMNGSALQEITIETLRRFSIALPIDVKEQTAIGNVLSDSDALIDALEQLIAKKQAIKTAAMQQLLTGRTRLPQFALRADGTPKGYKTSELGQIPEDWITPTLKDITSNIIDYRGRTPRKLGLEWGGGNILALSAGNVKKGFIDYEAECYFGSDELYKKWMTSGDASKGDIVFTMEAPLGNAALIPNEDKYILSQRTILLQLECSKFLPMFIIQVFLSDMFQSYISESATGSTAQGIKRATFEKMFVAVPSCLEEQTAIATILSDMDSELAALEQKLAKARSLKQGMMQQLLTGRIRLPLPKEA
ncbi:restriction endonuclease subunit S [Aeromonas sp. FDAARGOS 1415]|uniref:restriction endonuclease subunit S n=1 Tax=Aeromonas TaxID=642 RepID=UPI001C216121|nr:restriction endonuclease subunit S [Aeromonas sp. FDAARGOS 1415]QXB53883.1 restriction endonuclease subunit S [Aeromonas sp. FDAARGOS 1415]